MHKPRCCALQGICSDESLTRCVLGTILVIQLTEDELEVVESQETFQDSPLECDEANESNVLYELVAVVSHIKDAKSNGNLVAEIKVSLPSRSPFLVNCNFYGLCRIKRSLCGSLVCFAYCLLQQHGLCKTRQPEKPESGKLIGYTTHYTAHA